MSDRRSRTINKIFDRVEPDFSCMLHGAPCLLWTGPTSGTPKEGDRNSRGHSYPRMTLDGATVPVHHVIYTHFYGYIPYNKTIDHECCNRLCVQPLHLSMVTHLENTRRRDGKKPRGNSEYGTPIPANLAAEFERLMKRVLSKYKCEEVAA